MKKYIYIIALYLFATGLVQAQTTYTWTNRADATPVNWTTVGNWNGGVEYVSDSANELVFLPDNTTINPAAGTQTITNVPTTLSMGIVTLQGKGPNNTTGFTINIGDNLSTWTIGNGATGTVNLNATVHTSPERTILYNVGPNITLNQANTIFTGNGSADQGRYGGGFNFLGNVTESTLGSGITKSGSSTLKFSGTNTYTGVTTVSGGTLRLGSAAALPGGIGTTGGTSALTLNNGVLELASTDFLRNLGTGSGQFRITGGTSGFSAFGAPRVVSVNGDAATELEWDSADFAPSTLVLNATTANNAMWLANNINLSNATARTVQVNAREAILSGDIRNTAAGGLTKTGNGTLVLSGTNTYNGDTTLTAGTLSVGESANLGSGSSGLIMNGGGLQITGTALTSISGIGHAVTFNNNAKAFDIQDASHTFTVDQALSGTTLTKSGAGTLALNQDNSLSGATTVTGGGTLVLDYSSNNGSKLANQALNLNGGNLVLRGGSLGKAVTSIVIGLPTNSGLPPTGNSISRDGGSSATIANTGVLTVNTYSNLDIAEAGIVSGIAANHASGIQTLGRVTVGSHFASNDVTNVLQAYGGYVNYTAAAGGGDLNTVNQLTGGGTMAASLTSYSLRIANAGNSDVLELGTDKQLIVSNQGTVLYAGGSDNNYTINGSSTAAVKPATGNQPLNMNIFTGTLTVNAILTSGGGGYLIKSGAGTLVVGGNNTFTAATYIQQGVFRAATNAALGAVSTGTLGTFVQGGAALELTGDITIGAEALSLAGHGISNGGALRNLSGNNTYGGVITIGGGGARINSDSGTLALTGGIVTEGGQTITFGGAGNITVSTNGIQGAANLIKDGAGTLELVVTDSAVQSTCGDMTLNDGKLQITFDVAPSPSVAALKIMGDLTFAGTPTINVTLDKDLVSTGELYPLFTVGGSAEETVPTLEGFAGGLKWGGPDNKTLYLNTGARGTLFIIR